MCLNSRMVLFKNSCCCVLYGADKLHTFFELVYKNVILILSCYITASDTISVVSVTASSVRCIVISVPYCPTSSLTTSLHNYETVTV